MKLQTKINNRFLAILLVVFLIAGVSLYFVLGLLVNNNLDETLLNKSLLIRKNLANKPSTFLLNKSLDQTITIKPSFRLIIPVTFSDTVILNINDNEMIDYRKMDFGTKSNGKYYKISIVLSKLETEDLVELTFSFMLLLFGIIALILFFLNQWMSSSVWSPFYKMLEKLNTFRIGQKGDVTFDKSNVYEFNQLNESLKEMVIKAQSDYNNLKEFTENASHEIQTPIAVIQSKLEFVLQDKSLSLQRYQQIQSAYESASRLSKINQALLLLAKIENQQFPEVTKLDLCELIKQRLEFLEELIDFRGIKIILNLEHPFIVKMNFYLAEILVNNLLSNAIKHNIEDGQILIISFPDKLIISNTGKPLTIVPEKLFQRFAKHNAGNDSTGLGLAIASEICIKSDLVLQYNYEDGFHKLIIGHKP